MSYRTYINGHEWLGNNEGPQVILDELKRQGCPFNADWCTPHDPETHESLAFEIKDLQGLVEATEKAIIKMYEANPDIANFGSSVDGWNHNLTYRMRELAEYAYIFWTVALLKYVGEENYTVSFDWGKKRETYTLKPGVKCLFEAY